ncbi:TPA: glycoside hydrolase family 125 protein [Streptococcus equi subsp. zooepidemicus]|nr:glycoside hydrolase family 125 protein [Streptococcus equi subsp. zooepidemicus]HEL1191774.1 glycoside hydrolase family 125 protein [Streptococcus equi subsp. zooepidemicus]
MTRPIPSSVLRFMDTIEELCGEEHRSWAINFKASFANTLETTLKTYDDGTSFLLTGDIPAMWLRDSTAQLKPYLFLAKTDASMRQIIAGLVKRQFRYICIDPYANAFNEKANSKGHQADHTQMGPWIWERKYEIDSLCYPIQLAYLLYRETGCTDHFNEDFHRGIKLILDVWSTEQDHTASPYSFERDTWRKEDTLTHNGKGAPVAYTGMTWSGFRPSDDACQYGYLVPSNMFAAVVLSYLEGLYTDLFKDQTIARRAHALRLAIQKGIEEHALVTNSKGETIYAYEVDGMGHYAIMDDANIPSLLAAPYLGFCAKDDPIYLATRQTILSSENPYYYQGSAASGIGSSHTPKNYIWHIALALQGLTALDQKDKADMLDLLVATDAGTHLMHEGFDVNDPSHYTREWFSWANMMFCELLLDYLGFTISP